MPDTTGITSPNAAGATNTQGLADWAAPYVTNYLGQAQALSQQPYQVYGGPLTAGPSAIQNQVFQGIGGLTVPQNLGQSFTSAGAPTPPPAGGMGGMTAPAATGGIASQYMNPYLQNVLNPQLAELQRNSQIQGLTNAAKATQAGAFGGSRSALMDAELNRNLMQEQNKTVGQGYANAFDTGRQQFNTEQQTGQNLTKLMTDVGGVQRGITAEGTAADKAEFEAQRQFPYQQVQFQRDMMSGLPISSITNQQASLSGLPGLISAVGGIGALNTALGTTDLTSTLQKLGINIGG